MSGPWYIQDPDLYRSVHDLISRHYPGLVILVRKSTIVIKGAIDIIDPITQKLITTYSVEIRLPPNYPEGYPTAIEVGDKIPRIADRHVYPTSGELCLAVVDEYWKYYTPTSSIVDFIEKLLKPYLLNQVYFDLNGKYLSDGRSHGGNGIVEYYREELETDEYITIWRFVNYLGQRRIKPHWPCYCGSGEKLKSCHLPKLLEMRSKIPVFVARRSLRFLVLPNIR